MAPLAFPGYAKLLSHLTFLFLVLFLNIISFRFRFFGPHLLYIFLFFCDVIPL